MDSLVSYRESDSDTSLQTSRGKRRKIDAEPQSSETAKTEVKWRSESAQRAYSLKLVEALRGAGQNDPPPVPSGYIGGRVVRDVADRVLAMAAKGRTRWSRAILASRLRRSRLRRHRKVKKNGSSIRPRKPLRDLAKTRKKRLPAVERKVNVLSRLVPGCRGIPVTNLLEEAGDYIAALEMQVRAMTALTEILSGSLNVRPGS
ncbi:hypothetical protein SAY86_028349 [Trapa natans]|uniref:IBH1-like N-terminal domain-containing protein n=1 Tax=Trapa natans TaxID=22666 RepID=A0AAN7RGB5_TRANT|nr:hypothetical protein SAY86_028349 [Trapa natans]